MAVGLAAAGCGSSATATTPTTPPGSTAAATVGTALGVTETEFALALTSTTVPAGTYTFRIHNAGHVAHSLTVSGPGVDQSAGHIGPGSTATMTVRLAAGSYDVFCPIGAHRQLGMDAHVTVT